MRELFAIGHITNDLLPAPHLGGGVSYSAVAGKRLGMSSHIVTKLPPNHKYIQELRKLKVRTHNLSIREAQSKDKITTFKNYYDEKGNRTQIVSERQENIGMRDLPGLFPQISDDSIILVAPVIGEVDINIFPELAKKGSLIVTPQGYFRSINADGIVKRTSWQDVDALQFAGIVILSDEDLTFGEEMDQNFLRRIRDLHPITVLTEGAKGLTVFEEDKEPIHIKPFGLESRELRDFTGAGDCAASAFIWQYFKDRNPKEAGAFAAFYPALKIMGIGEKEGGISALPTLEQIKAFTLENRERVLEFYRSNELALPAFLEGNKNLLERR